MTVTTRRKYVILLYEHAFFLRAPVTGAPAVMKMTAVCPLSPRAAAASSGRLPK